jgi:hypothetical protein
MSILILFLIQVFTWRSLCDHIMWCIWNCFQEKWSLQNFCVFWGSLTSNSWLAAAESECCTSEATLKCVFFFLLLLGAKQTSWRPKKSGGANDAKDIFWGKKWATSRPSSSHIMKEFFIFFLEVVIFRELISTCCQKLFRRNPKSFSTFLFHM